MDWFTIKNAEAVDSPALIIYPDRVKTNIQTLQGFVDDNRQLRPHVKTNKCPEVTQMMLDAGITKFKCATIAEAEMLAILGAPDVLLAYQPVGPKAERFCRLQGHYTRTSFACLIDNLKTLTDLSEIALRHHQQATVFLDLNVGMGRTGITPGKDALQLYLAAGELKGIKIAGLHAYDGHLRDTDFQLRIKKCDEAFKAVNLLREEITKATGASPVVVAGGSPTFPIHARNASVEASPGTFVFWDKGYEQLLSEQPFQFGALVMTRVISRSGDQTLCLDLGHKSIASENSITQRVYFLNAPDLVPIGHSEEHLVCQAPKDHHYQVGDILYGVPHHICPTVALYDMAGICTGNTVRESWTIAARRRKITI